MSKLYSEGRLPPEAEVLDRRDFGAFQRDSKDLIAVLLTVCRCGPSIAARTDAALRIFGYRP
jgi:hypothetical protein